MFLFSPPISLHLTKKTTLKRESFIANENCAFRLIILNDIFLSGPLSLFPSPPSSIHLSRSLSLSRLQMQRRSGREKIIRERMARDKGNMYINVLKERVTVQDQRSFYGFVWFSSL